MDEEKEKLKSRIAELEDKLEVACECAGCTTDCSINPDCIIIKSVKK